MAHVALMRTVYKSGGRAARGRLQYITRDLAQAQTPAERQLRYLREGREDLVYTNTRNLPGWAGGDPCRYFQEAERSERAPGRRNATGDEPLRSGRSCSPICWGTRPTCISCAISLT